MLTGKKNSDKEYDEYVLKVWNKCEMGTLTDDLNLYSECDILLSADGFENLEIMASREMDYF